MAATSDLFKTGEAASCPPDRAIRPAGNLPRSSRRLALAMWGFVALGVIVRVFRYAMEFPLWGDEAALAGNFLARGYRELLAPLEFFQVAPPLYLWTELTLVKAFGFSEYSLRLFPFACGIASIFLFRRVASRLFGGLPMLLAVGIFAVSPHPIRHAAEVKPYASDLLLALALLSLAVDWWREPGRSGRLWWLAAASPIALGMSYPAVFVAMGIGLAVAIPAWKSGRMRVRLASAACLVAPVASFFAWQVLIMGAQCEGGGLRGMREYWVGSFPPLGEPLRLLRWLVLTHTGSMFAYPDGGQRGGSTATAVFCVIAVVALGRRGDRVPLAILLAPFGMTFLAATIRRYPYGGEARIAQHLAPMICLLAGSGMAVVLSSLPRPRDFTRGLAAAVIGLTLIGIGSVVRDFATPYRSDFEHSVREFARWFWADRGRDAELACVRSDFGVIESKSLRFVAALHVCYREICRPSLPPGSPRLGTITGDHPLRLAVYGESTLASPPFLALKDALSARFPLRSIERFIIESRDGPTRQVVIVYEFAPPSANPGPIAIRETRRLPPGPGSLHR